MKTTTTIPVLENTIMSGHYQQLVDSSKANFPARLDPNVESVPEVFKSYQYPVCTWPVIIDSETVERLKTLSLVLPKLLRRIPELIFNNDVDEIADFYFNGNRLITEFAMICHDKNLDVSSRLDLTLTEEGFKTLEVNMGSSLGGFQVQSFEQVIRSLHSLLNSSQDLFLSPNIPRKYFEFFVSGVLQHLREDLKEINVFVVINEENEKELRDNSFNFFANLITDELQRRDLKGNVFTGELHELTSESGNLVYKGSRIHGLSVLSSAERMPPITLRSFILNKTYLASHLGVSLLSDKRNLVFLQNLALKNAFTEEENKLILSSIPYSQIVQDTKVIFRGAEHNLLDLLKKHKDEFVIKDAGGAQGKDVFVGKFLTDREWEEAISYSCQSQNFIAQEYCDSKNFVAPNAANEWVDHKLIWGAFGFGDIYGGVWVRMSEVRTDVGVINSAKGAVEAIVFEAVEN